MDLHQAALELAGAHTRAVIRQVPDAAWDRPPAPGAFTLRDQVRHIALVRESILRCLAGEPTAGLGAVFETREWMEGGAGAVDEAYGAHVLRCRDLLSRLRPEDLDRPFTTPFGNRSTPRNYLRVMLLEETHHRAQMTLTLRLFGVDPPEYPGRAWVELGL